CVVVASDAYLRMRPTVVFAVPLTTTNREFPSHIPVPADPANGLTRPSWVQVEQLRSVSSLRCSPALGNVGAVVTAQIHDVLAMLTGA
ncbi:MAG TPA: type II toxin-antitoxin system PemK/MazF family toxin, partial [Ilumatobacteraceae bacterium]|nr:type II toxin-antitoxin system PemK/MazF family toxin [Ilumatobacteraceae bacterium]